VWVGEGEPVPHALRIAARGRAIVLEPAPRWPDEERLGLRLRDGFVAADGRAWTVDTSTFAVALRPQAPPRRTPRVSRIAPTSGAAAPGNLRYLGLVIEPPEPLAELALRQRGFAWRLIPEAQAAGRVRVRLHDPGPRGPGTWTLEPPPGFEVATDLAGAVELDRSEDTDPPRPVSVATAVEADAVVVRLEADEPFFVRGRARTDGGAEAAVGAPPFILRSGVVRVDVAGPGVRHHVELELVDLAGNATALEPLRIRSAPEIDVEITEVVATPLRDWGDSDEAGRPFDPQPGDGSVSDTDEWVELVNRSPQALDLRGLDVRLETMDGTPSVTALASPPGAYFGAGGGPERWLPGEALVLRPRGSMSSRDVWIRVVSGERLLDDVRLADDGGDHPGGAPPDAWRESIARSAWGRWSWCRATPGDPAAAQDCAP